MFDFNGKTVLITGAAAGLGFSCAESFAKAGARVALVDISAEAVQQAAAQLDSETLAITADVSCADQVQAMVDQVVGAWGGLDIAVNNAGISSTLEPVAETSAADFDRVMAVNLKGVWLSMRAELNQMLRQNRGTIVNMASALSQRVFPGASFYVSSKFAVAGLTRTAAVEYAETPIRINAVCPGNVTTPLLESTIEDLDALASLHAMKRLGTPQEVANAVMFLASDLSSFNTGTLLPVDGGWTAQ
ncbi:glucose 1-dehydrogenase [Aestuariicella sp. G3-2]|uniref:SDR family NAD(P)-dependent oxidoreductase n=1 Tax=Pseudomaricurvus albidus TaxID=2842452 RepID=UPI001C0BDEB7|nr:glucose 1-dehydrogenase [Aestuariicella albida]MBU3071254.1 glucose 1-dehydrogenase [Aestuariicella albida]